jgi:hypothetical protein
VAPELGDVPFEAFDGRLMLEVIRGIDGKCSGHGGLHLNTVVADSIMPVFAV